MIRLTDIIIAAVASYGAVLSTITLIRQIRQGNINIKVKMSFSIPVIDGTIGNTTYCFTASNHGLRTVTLSSFGINIPKEKLSMSIPFPSVHLPFPKFPYELKPGSNCSAYTEVDELEKALHKNKINGKIKLVPYFDDALGNRHRGKRFYVHLK